MQKNTVHANFLTEGHEPSNQPWIVPKLFRARSLGMLSAEPNSLKTWSGLDLCRASVEGGRWLGHGPITQGAVMLVLLDSTIGDSASQFRRLTQDLADSSKESRDLIQDLVFRYNIEPGQLDLMKRESRDALIEAANSFVHKTRTWAGGIRPKDDPAQPELAAEGAPTGFWNITYEGAPEHDAEGEIVTPIETERDPAHQGVQIIILDSLSKISSAQESVAEQMGVVTANLRIIAEKTGTLVLVLHHDRKKSSNPMFKSSNMDMVRGSSVIPASFETIISLESRSDDGLHVHYHVTKQRGVKLPDWDVTLDLEGDTEEDNRHALTLWATYEEALAGYLSDESYRQWDPDGTARPSFTVETLYPAPWPYARARLMSAKGAEPVLALFLKYVVSIGGTTDLEAAAQWVLDSEIITSVDDPAERLKAAKKWVKNRAGQARKDGWLQPARQDAKGSYEASPRAHKFYATTNGFSGADAMLAKVSAKVGTNGDDIEIEEDQS